MSDLERVALLNNLFDRVYQLEQRYMELASGTVAIQEVLYRDTPGEGLLSGWVATGKTFRDAQGLIVLDVTLPGIILGSGGIIRSADYIPDMTGFRIDGGIAEFNNVSVRGTIFATSGSIAGWTIEPGHLYAGSDTTRAGLRPADFPFYAGDEVPSNAPFRVSTSGALTATNASITGNITASSGNIGGWVISSDRLAATNIRLISGAANTARLEAGTGTNANTAGINSPNASGDIALWAGSTHANRATAPFRVTAAGALNASNATITGNITATSGSIGGWTIDTNHLYAGSGSTRAGLRPADYPFYAGSETPENAPFRVTPAGFLLASNVSITGHITSTSGSIGGWAIFPDRISSTNIRLISGTVNTARLEAGTGTDANTAGINSPTSASDIALWAGATHANRANAPFRVTAGGALAATSAAVTGNITATSGNVGGWTIDTGHLYAGSGSTRTGLRPADFPFYAGSETPSAAPFRVTPAGALMASNATITGNITATMGNIGGWSILSDHLAATNARFISGAANTARLEVGTGTDANTAGMNSTSAANDIALWSGATHANRANAPFRVTAAGVLNATSANITGTITATSGAFTGTVTVGTVSPRIEIDGANARIRSSDYIAGQRGITMEANGFAEFGNVDVRGALKATTFEYGQIFVTGGTFIIARGAGKLLNDCTSVDSPSTFNVDIEDPDGLNHASAGGLWNVNDRIRLKDALTGDLWATVSSKTDMSTYWRLVCVKQSPGAGTNYTFRRGMAVTNYGQAGQGFLHLTADETNAPYYSVRTHAGSPWSSITELARLGNLAGNWGYASAIYGIALGEYASNRANLTWDSTNGLRLRTHATTVIQLDNAGSARIEGVLNIGGSGGIYQGTGSFANPTTGLKIWNESGIGQIAGYAQGVLQWGAGTDGRLYTAGGKIWLDSMGLNLHSGMGETGTIRFFNNDTGQLQSDITAYSTPTTVFTTMRVFKVTNKNSSIDISVWAPQNQNGNIYLYSVSDYGSQIGLLVASTPSRGYAEVLYGDFNVSHGGLSVGTNVQVGSGNIIYTSNLRPVRSGTTYTGYIVVPLTIALTHANLSGGSLATGTYSIGPVGSGATYEFNYPAAARALFVRLNAAWATASSSNLAYLRPFGASGSEANPIVRAQAANIVSDDCGFTPLDGNARAQLVVAGANAVSIWVIITGYAL